MLTQAGWLGKQREEGVGRSRPGNQAMKLLPFVVAILGLRQDVRGGRVLWCHVRIACPEDGVGRGDSGEKEQGRGAPRLVTPAPGLCHLRDMARLIFWEHSCSLPVTGHPPSHYSLSSH